MPAGACNRCGVERPWLHRHHVVFRSDGGTDADGIDGPMGGRSTQRHRQRDRLRPRRNDASHGQRDLRAARGLVDVHKEAGLSNHQIGGLFGVSRQSIAKVVRRSRATLR